MNTNTIKQSLSVRSFSSRIDSAVHNRGTAAEKWPEQLVKPAEANKDATKRLKRFPPRTETILNDLSAEWTQKIRSNVMLQGTRVKKSPFFDATLKHGCNGFTVYNKTVMPIAWEGQNAMDEYVNLTSNVNLYDASIQRQVEISGPDAYRLAQYLCSRNLKKQKIGRCMYAICTDEDGIVINDPLILKLAEDRYWFSIADRDLALWAKAHAVGRFLDVKVEEPDVASVSIQGPKSVDLLCDIWGSELEDLKFFNFREVEWHGIRTYIARAGWSPERGYEIYMDGNITADMGEAMWEELVQKGEKYGLMFGSPNQYRRLEGGMLSSCDYENTKLNALELGLPPNIVTVDGDWDFVGKAALQKQVARGVNRTTAGVVFDNDSPMDGSIYHIWKITGADDSKPGYLSSVGFSPRLQSYIGIATLPVDLAEEGTRLVIHTPDGPRKASVAKMPFEGTINTAHKGPSTKMP